MGLITVGMDESDLAAAALRWALEEGDRRGWSVSAVLAWTFLRQHQVDRTDTHDPTYDDDAAARALTTYVQDAVGARSTEIALATACELPGPALVEASADSDLLVLASHGHGGVRGLVIGSVSQHCLHHATVPVAIIREIDRRTDVKVGKVVVGVDGSDTSARALAWALDEARSRGGYVEVVSSWSIPPAAGIAALAVPDLSIYEAAAEHLVDHMVEQADTSGLSRPVSRVVVGGTSTVGLLVGRAANAELLVVGSRGIGGFGGMVVGSVAHQLAHHSPCPLVVLHA